MIFKRNAACLFAFAWFVGSAHPTPILSENATQNCQPVICSPHQIKASEHVRSLKPRRVVIVVPRNRKDRLKEQEMMAEAMAKNLNSCGISAVVCAEPVCQSELPMRRGVFDEAELLRLANRYRIDSVLYCDVAHFDWIDPMKLQTSLLLINVDQAVALVSMESSFDTNLPLTKAKYTKFARVRCTEIATDTHRHSPSLFMAFAAHEVANALQSTWK